MTRYSIPGVRIFPDNPLRFDFIVDPGDSELADNSLKEESSKLIKYFLASMTVPDEDMWVNLSPYEKDRIIPNEFGKTEMGRDLLAQDYMLKQITASLMYPEEEIGQEFWSKIYKKANDLYGVTEVPVNTFNKVWIVPEKAAVYQNGDIVFVTESHLNVMLEEDYLALEHTSISLENDRDNSGPMGTEKLDKISTSIIREIIIPELEKEVNTGKNFANLRQIYHSVILATWFKRNLKESFLGKVYVDQNKVEGVNVSDEAINEKIYQQYLEAFKVGVYDFIKEEVDAATQEVIPRKYFSGGVLAVPAIIERGRTSRGIHLGAGSIEVGVNMVRSGGVNHSSSPVENERNLKVGPLTLKTGVIPDLLAMQVEQYGDRAFLKVPSADPEQGYHDISFNQFNDRVERMQKVLFAQGIKQGDRVAFLSPNRPEFLDTVMGVWGLGAQAVSMNFDPKVPQAYREHVIENSNAKYLVVTAGPFLQMARALKEVNPELKILVMDPLPAQALKEDEISLATWQNPGDIKLPEVDISPDDTALILYTSGTTKMPKGVPLTHKILMYNREASAKAWEGKFTDQDMTLGWLPFFHVMGIPFEFLGNLYVGARYAFPRLKPGPPTPDQLYTALRDTGANVFYTVPAMLEGQDGKPGLSQMAQSDPEVLETLQGLKFIMSGGAPFADLNVAQGLIGQGVPIINGYGMTEAGGALALGDPSRPDPEALYLLPIPDEQLAENPDITVPQGQESPSQLVLDNSPTITEGYLNNPEATNAAISQTGVFSTGDHFYQRAEDGALIFAGRFDEVVKDAKGEKHDLFRFEQGVERSPKIKRAAKIAAKRPWGILIVEPEYSQFKGQQWMEIEESVWESVEEVNADFFPHEQIRRENIIILPPGEFIPQVRKGSLDRRAILSNFTEQIDEIYSQKDRAKKRAERQAGRIRRVREQTEGLLKIKVDKHDHLGLTLALIDESRRVRAAGEFTIAGGNVNLGNIVAVGRNHDLKLKLTDSKEVRSRIDGSITTIEDAIRAGKTVYGATTGLGGHAKHKARNPVEISAELLRFILVGYAHPDAVDQYLTDRTVRQIVNIRANQNAIGFSGVRVNVIENLLQLLNAGVVPLVPSISSITASGDLTPLGHIVGVLIEEKGAQARYQGEIISSKRALEIARLSPIQFGPKEGLGLINGTTGANAMIADLTYDANVTMVLMQGLAALSIEALLGSNQSFDPVIGETKPHPGQIEILENILHLLGGSQLARDELDGEKHIEDGRIAQDRYSLRGVAQTLAASMEDLVMAVKRITTEANSVTDNPLTEVKTGRTLHTAQFLGHSLEKASQEVKTAIAQIAQLAFALTEQLSKPAYNNGLLQDLGTDDPVLDHGLKGLSIANAAIVSEVQSKLIALQAFVRSAEQDNQDVNSLALISARTTRDVLHLTQMLLTNLYYTAIQAIDLRNIEQHYRMATEEAVTAAVKQTLPTLIENPAEIEPLMIAHLIKEVRRQLPYPYAFEQGSRYQPLMKELAGKIEDILRNNPKVLGVIKVQLTDVESVAGYYQRFRDVLADELDHRLPQAKEEALQQGAAHLLGNTRPLYEFMRRDLGIKLNDMDKAPAIDLQQIVNAINDGRIIDPLMNSFFMSGGADHVASSPVSKPGGIDFNTNNIKLKTQGTNVDFDFTFDPKDFETTPVNGFIPVIFQITPITNIPMLLGEAKEPEEQLLSRAID